MALHTPNPACCRFRTELAREYDATSTVSLRTVGPDGVTVRSGKEEARRAVACPATTAHEQNNNNNVDFSKARRL